MFKRYLPILYLPLTLVLVVGLLLFGESCRQAETYFEVREGWFFTNDLAKAQQEIPFKIVLPTYMPSNGSLAGFTGYTKERLQELSVEGKGYVIITYHMQPGAVATFEEKNAPSQPPWLGSPGTEELFIVNTRVVILLSGQYGPDLKPTYDLWWSRDGVFFKASIDSSRDEAIKIVSSMIE